MAGPLLGELSLEAWARQDAAAKPPVSVSAPVQLTFWTRQPDARGGSYLFGDPSGLRTLVDPPSLVDVDMNAGYPDAFTRKEDSGDAVPVEVILQATRQAGQPPQRASIVTFRNNLNKLGLTHLAPSDPWVIDAVWLPRGEEYDAATNGGARGGGGAGGGTMYLQIVKGEERDFPDKDRFMYYGYHFEALCCGAAPGEHVDATGEFAVVFQLRLGRHRLLLAAETDAWDTPPEDMEERDGFVGYAECKTYTLPAGERARERFFRDKYPRWWLQSFLAGVPTLVAGGRDRAGVLRKVDRLPVARLPALAAAGGGPFDAGQMLRWMDAALGWMGGVAERAAGQQVRFEYVPGRKAIVALAVEGGDLPARVEEALTAPLAVAEEPVEEEEDMPEHVEGDVEDEGGGEQSPGHSGEGREHEDLSRPGGEYPQGSMEAAPQYLVSEHDL